MEGGRRSSTSTALLLLLALITLAANSATAAAAAQRRQPPSEGSYKLITLLGTSRGAQVRILVRAHDSSIAGFANGKNNWFAIHGSEDLLEPLRNKYGGGADIPAHGLVNMLGAMLNKN